MTWKYYEEENDYIDPKGIRVSFNNYRKKLIKKDL